VGCACLRGGGYRWPDCGAGCVATRRWQQGGVAYQPDAAGPYARSQFLRRGGNPDPIRLGVAQGQRNADSDTNAVPHPDAVGVSQPVGQRERQRLGDTLSVAIGDGHAITLADAQWQRETLDLALSQAPTRSDPAPGEKDRRSGPVVSASSQRITVPTGRG
jgi:hypothetical protein